MAAGLWRWASGEAFRVASEAAEAGQQELAGLVHDGVTELTSAPLAHGSSPPSHYLPSEYFDRGQDLALIFVVAFLLTLAFLVAFFQRCMRNFERAIWAAATCPLRFFVCCSVFAFRRSWRLARSCCACGPRPPPPTPPPAAPVAPATAEREDARARVVTGMLAPVESAGRRRRLWDDASV